MADMTKPIVIVGETIEDAASHSLASKYSDITRLMVVNDRTVEGTRMLVAFFTPRARELANEQFLYNLSCNAVLSGATATAEDLIWDKRFERLKKEYTSD